MAVRGFDQLASALNERQLVLRQVACFRRQEEYSGADVLSGENLVYVSLRFDGYEANILSLGESDEIEISQRPFASDWVARIVSDIAPWNALIGSVLVNAWQLSNSRGYDDCMCLEFKTDGASSVRLLLESAASFLHVFNVTPVQSNSAA